MNSRIKPIIIIFTTLFIGFGAGFLTSGMVARYRLDHFKGFMAKEEVFERNMGKMINASPEQMDSIRPILRKHFPGIHETQKEFGRAMRSKMDSLRTDLKPYLNEEQIELLLRRPPFRRPKGRRRPGGPPPRK